MQLPEIRMEYGWLLDKAFEGFYNEIPDNVKKEKGYLTQGRDEVVDKIPLFEAEWKKIEKKVVPAMCEILDLEFYKKIIDVYIVGAYKGAFSTPLVMSAKYEPDLFIDILTHELLHVLLTDNTKKVKVRMIWSKMFPDVTDRTCINHILVHAVHKEIYLKVFESPERLERDLKKSLKRKSYNDAWNIVEKKGHMNIIEEFKNYYLK